MSLKTRLRTAIVTLVTLLVLAQCLVSLNIAAEANFRNALEWAQSVAQQVRNLVLQRVNEQAAAVIPGPANLEASKALWEGIVERDSALPSLLEKTMASSSAVVEILVCGEAGRILATSSPSPLRATYRSLPDFAEWQVRPLWDRLIEVLTQSKDYALVVPLGLEEPRVPILTIQVVISSVLLRNAVLPQVRSLAILSVLSLLGSMLLAVLFSNVLLRSLERLSQRIDLMTTGKLPSERHHPAKEAKEFAAVQSKLDLLSEQFRGAREDVLHLRGNIAHMLERLEETVLLFDPEHRLILASRPAERLLGTPRDEMVGRGLAELFPESMPLGAAIREAVEQQQPFRDRIALVERNGAPPLRLLVNVELLESYPGRSRFGTLVTLRDAETRRQLRSQLDISTRLAAISRLTGGVAHEIKNPLNAMALHLEILKSKLSEPSQVQPELEVIGREIARLDRVVKTFLDFTRPVEVQMREVNLTALVREVSALVRPEAERRQVAVELQASAESAVIRGDQDLLKQAILNVVVNGIEAMKHGGRLLIQVRREAEDYLVLVADQGSGIPAELRDKVFNLYFSTKEKGSGIGLAMTFRVVQLHNATIDFTSEPGQGTTFHLRFPAPEEQLPIPAASVAGEGAAGPK